MRPRRSLPLLAAVFLAASLVLAGGAISAVTSERGVALAVVDDGRAYLGVRPATPLELPAGESRDRQVVRLTNRFPSTLDEIAVSVTGGDDGPPTVTGVRAPARLGPGEAGWITADVDCGAGGTEETVTVAIEASGRDAVALARDVTVVCEAPADDAPAVERYAFGGCGEVRVVLAAALAGPVNATFRVYDAAAETTRDVDVTMRPGDLEPGPDDLARVYAFDVDELLGPAGEHAVLGAAVGGRAPTENPHSCGPAGG